MAVDAEHEHDESYSLSDGIRERKIKRNLKKGIDNYNV